MIWKICCLASDALFFVYNLQHSVLSQYHQHRSAFFRHTVNDRYSGDRFSGNDGFSGTKTPDDAILFTVSGITAIVEQKFRKFRGFFPKR